MIKNIFICNIYDPRKKDFEKNFFKAKESPFLENYKKIFFENLKKVTIGDPKPTKKMSVEKLKEKNIVGLYTTEQTSYNFFSSVVTNPLENNNKKRKKMREKVEEEELMIEDFSNESDEKEDFYLDND